MLYTPKYFQCKQIQFEHHQESIEFTKVDQSFEWIFKATLPQNSLKTKKKLKNPPQHTLALFILPFCESENEM